ncbi:hypothetical protein [Actinoalloteichus hymeniacidonis]|uniref:Uncharacterized protein n=1 Tax=Actinoalloteichus hymeniacidonis TaxID=340345 RepID=A0AAC9HPQ0_9PSEU|nr:hypothetical protein [Actinoalloteichus hymeniacidonis]AOS63053.1 hypothetical protein TL08_11195 [Actinoalloteichus hymeniacidonis]MBB5908912.1 hypothetical protein [Actinoalloteichus hymeniacidonis]
MPSITLPTFVSYTASGGAARITTIHQQRRRYENPEPAAFNFYRRPADAIRAGLATHREELAMTTMVQQAHAVQRPHYEAIADGWLALLADWHPRLVDVGRARWSSGNLEVRISPHLGLLDDDNRLWSVFLHFKEAELTREGSYAPLRLMEQNMDELLPGGAPLVIDVRRSRVFKATNRSRQRLDAWLTGEAAAFSTHWACAA